jgi:hypothetical protein
MTAGAANDRHPLVTNRSTTARPGRSLRGGRVTLADDW